MIEFPPSVQFFNMFLAKMLKFELTEPEDNTGLITATFALYTSGLEWLFCWSYTFVHIPANLHRASYVKDGLNGEYRKGPTGTVRISSLSLQVKRCQHIP